MNIRFGKTSIDCSTELLLESEAMTLEDLRAGKQLKQQDSVIVFNSKVLEEIMPADRKIMTRSRNSKSASVVAEKPKTRSMLHQIKAENTQYQKAKRVLKRAAKMAAADAPVDAPPVHRCSKRHMQQEKSNSDMKGKCIFCSQLNN